MRVLLLIIGLVAVNLGLCKLVADSERAKGEAALKVSQQENEQLKAAARQPIMLTTSFRPLPSVPSEFEYEVMATEPGQQAMMVLEEGAPAVPAGTANVVCIVTYNLRGDGTVKLVGLIPKKNMQTLVEKVK